MKLDGVLSIADRLYLALLARVRARFGAEMAQVFRDTRQAAARRAMSKRPFWAIITVVITACTSAATRPSPTPFPGTPRPVIVDTDMATDDWLAILYLLQRPDISIKAITVAGDGETHCRPGVDNALGLAALAGQPGIPVACGRETPLHGTHTFPAEWRERSDSLLDLTLPDNSNGPARPSATELLTVSLQSAAEPVTVLTLGPLTNLAEALEAAPSLAGSIAQIYIMGGAVKVDGNVGGSGAGIDNRYAEWNIYVDPYAANVVFNSGAPITLVPLDATNHTPVTRDFYDRLKADRLTPESRFIYEVLTQETDFIASGRFYFWDPLAAAILTDESLAAFDSLPLAVMEDEGPDSGRLTLPASGPEIRFAHAVDRVRFERLYLDTLNAP